MYQEHGDFLLWNTKALYCYNEQCRAFYKVVRAASLFSSQVRKGVAS